MAKKVVTLKPTHEIRGAMRTDGVEATGVKVYVGDCRELLPRIPEVKRGEVDLVFADPPFNWSRAYDEWDDKMPRNDYLDFTYEWLDLCIGSLRDHGTMWVNIPDDTAAEIVMHMKMRGMHMVNWCVWHYRFGQNTKTRFIGSKVHALYFAKDPKNRRWNAGEVLEMTSSASGSQTRINVLEVEMIRPSGRGSKPVIPVACLLKIRTLPSAGSHSFTVLSLLPLAIRPSGSAQTQVTDPPCWAMVRTGSGNGPLMVRSHCRCGVSVFMTCSLLREAGETG